MSFADLERGEGGGFRRTGGTGPSPLGDTLMYNGRQALLLVMTSALARPFLSLPMKICRWLSNFIFLFT